MLPVDRWVYYCVDDFSEWPGLDRETLRRMDQEMIRRADALVAVSEPLQGLIAAEGRTSVLLTHGVDQDFWSLPSAVRDASTSSSSAIRDIPGPRVVFWGVVDQRLDANSLHRLSAELSSGTIILIGPLQNPEASILALPNVVTLPAQPLTALPDIARDADVLVMPYADLPVTRAMQPLKLKEYLATGRPVVVNRLPAVEAWSDCLDTADNAAGFSALVRQRLLTGLPPTQRQSRERLREESWESKAEVLRKVLERKPAVSLTRSVVR
jgi:glycosyltransferase involved in cell wall biosynthesis